MSFPSVSPLTAIYAVSASDENKIIKSGAAAGTELTSILPNLGTVSNGFTVGFAMNTGIRHTIVIAEGRNEKIAVSSEYVKRLSLRSENEVVFLTVDDVGNWRITGGTAYPSIPFRVPPIVETGEGVIQGHHVPFLDENVNFGGTYLGWVNSGPSPVHGAPNVEIAGPSTPPVGETVGIRIEWNGGASADTANYRIQSGDDLEQVARGLAADIVARPAIVNAGFFTYAIPGSNRLNLQWLTTTPGPVVLTPQNSANVTVRIPFSSEATDFIVFQLGRTYERAAMNGDALIGFDWTGPRQSPQLSTHWGQIAVQIVDAGNGPDQEPKARMYFTSRVHPETGEPLGTFYIERGGIVLYDGNKLKPEPAKGGSMGPGTINLPAGGGIYIDGVKQI